ncbi:MAG: MFS transporter [Gammaproteobacteria bacterium]|nr:MFS transporter [Gammaproteobacteria bacterium]
MIGLGKAPCDDGVIQSSEQHSECTQAAKPWVLAATILGSSMAFIDGSVVNVALPAIATDLAASVAGMQWVVNAYALLLASLILISGVAGDRFGRRRVFALGIVLFMLASVWCGLAADVEQLIFARAVQGVGGAMLVPSSLAIISATFETHERGRAIGTWAGFSAVTAALGPVLGGWLVDAVSWRAIFFINVPLALLALMITLTRVPESRANQENPALDWRGALLAVTGLAALTYGLIVAAELGWSHAVVIGALLAAVLILSVFLRVEARAASPMLPLTLFRSPTFSGANLMTLLLYFGLSGSLFFLPFNLIQVQDYSATQAGAAFLPFTIIMGGLSRWAGGLLARYGARPPLVVGPVVAACGLALFAWPGIGGSYWTTFFPGMVVLALGMTISVAPLTTTVINAVDNRYAGTASGVNNAVSRTATLLAVAVLGVVALQVFRVSLDERLMMLNVPPAIEKIVVRTSDRLAGVQVPANATPAAREALQRAADESFVTSFRAVMLTAAGCALAGAACAGLMIAPATGGGQRRQGGATFKSGVNPGP